MDQNHVAVAQSKKLLLNAILYVMKHVISIILTVSYSYVYASMHRALFIMNFSQLNFGQYKRVGKFSYQITVKTVVCISHKILCEILVKNPPLLCVTITHT